MKKVVFDIMFIRVYLIVFIKFIGKLRKKLIQWKYWEQWFLEVLLNILWDKFFDVIEKFVDWNVLYQFLNQIIEVLKLFRKG